MRAASFQDALRRLPVTSPEAFLAAGPVVILAPHPDDETLGTGGLMAAAAAAGRPPTVLVLTDGAGSHPRSKAYGKERLIALRQDESRAAAGVLGVPDRCLHHLGQPDTALPADGPAFDRLVEDVMAKVEGVGARTVLVTWDKDPHCDHEAAAALARAMRRRDDRLSLWFYPVWGWHLEAEDAVDAPPPDGYRLDIAPYQAAKREAIAAHASQMTDLIADDPEGFRFTPETLGPFLDRYEYVFRVP
jgi:LmbE family N-acetylglucosaminyl deacetylase